MTAIGTSLVAFAGALLADRWSKRAAVGCAWPCDRELAFGLALARVVNASPRRGSWILGHQSRLSGAVVLSVAAALAGVAAVQGLAAVAAGIALALGGAVSNHAEFSRTSSVLDCLKFRNRVAFNVADIAIVSGIAIAGFTSIGLLR